jgi:chemotaxis protein MotA
MSHLDDPVLLAHGISAAFVATFWGVFVANGIMLPFSNKLKRLSAEEVEYRAMLMEGVMSIQAGKNPRVVEETLVTFLATLTKQKINGSDMDGIFTMLAILILLLRLAPPPAFIPYYYIFPAENSV